jgi:phenylpropionate dioxygenase-like ring-hydroxylating dioxygenase large terminal subunit
MTIMLTELLTKDEVDRATASLESAWTLPPKAYISPDVFELERVKIFSNAWLCVAREEQLPNPGDYLSLDLIDQPVVLTRDRAGTLRALSRVCLHRAMPLVEGTGNVSRIVCPYHNWTYELDGSLRSAPMMDGVTDFEPERCRLPELKLRVWEGFIFVNLAGERATDFDAQTSGLRQALADYRLADLVIAETMEFNSPWNWKILVENFLEAYHHIGTHRETLQQTFPAKDAFVPDNDEQMWSLLRMPGNTQPDATHSSFPDLDEAQRAELMAAAIFPMFLLATSNEFALWFQLEPTRHDAMNLKIHVLMHPDMTAALTTESRAGLRDAITAVHIEDIAANEGPWKALHAPLTQQGRLSLHEKAIWQLNQYWLAQLEG